MLLLSEKGTFTLVIICWKHLFFISHGFTIKNALILTRLWTSEWNNVGILRLWRLLKLDRVHFEVRYDYKPIVECYGLNAKCPPLADVSTLGH